MAFWKRRARKAGKSMHEIWTKARRLVDDRRSIGDHRVSLADKLLDEYQEKGFPMSQHALDQLFGELVEGGAETTSSSMLTMILALAKNPWVQEKARKQMDQVCGSDRLVEIVGSIITRRHPLTSAGCLLGLISTNSHISIRSSKRA